MKISIDHIDYDLSDLALANEDTIDTIKRLGLPYENFVVDIDYEIDGEPDEEDMEAIDTLAYEAACEAAGEYADCVEDAGWCIY